MIVIKKKNKIIITLPQKEIQTKKEFIVGDLNSQLYYNTDLPTQPLFVNEKHPNKAYDMDFCQIYSSDG